MTSTQTPVVFRWALWNASPESIEMLSHSIGTFRHWFGDQPTYLVYTDAPDLVTERIRVPSTILPMNTTGAEYLDERATWLKWAPRFRHDITATEIRVDSDIFLVADPTELRSFIEGDGPDIVVTMEEFTQLWPYGNFGPRLPEQFTPINAGLLGQRAHTDLSSEIRDAYRWWNEFVRSNELKYHDEQGGIALILQSLIADGRVQLLDPKRYRVVCPLNDPPVQSLDGLVGLHATYPEHPAYHKFIDEISALSGVPAP